MRLVLRGKGQFRLALGRPASSAAPKFGDEQSSVRAARRRCVVASLDDVYEHLRPRFAGCMQEIFLAVALDARNGIIDIIEVARGCLMHVEVHPREVFRPLIQQAAAAAVVSHNHPSGDPTPSDQDIALSRRLRIVGDLMGIPVVDHLVVGEGRYVSMATQKLW